MHTIALAPLTVLLATGCLAPTLAASPGAQEKLDPKVVEAAAAQIQADIERLRGEKFPQPVPVKVADKATLVAYLAEREKLDTTPERLQFEEECAKLLGLIPPEMDLRKTRHAFLEAQIGGFYDPPTKTFYVMDTFTGDLAKVIMSHEFVHALDDQLYDLDGTAKELGQDSDRLLAFWALCEGSGTQTMTEWMLANTAKIDMQALMAFQELGMAGMEDLPPYVWKPALAAYQCGQSFVTKSKPKKPKKAKKDEDAKEKEDVPPAPTYSEQLARAFRDPPRSTEQVLHPEKYWDPAQKDEPRKITFDTTKLPEGWKVLGEDTLGELALALLTTPVKDRKGIDPKNMMALAGLQYTNKAAKGWGGDRLILLGRGDDRQLQLVTVWDTSDDAEEFREALDAVNESARVGVGQERAKTVEIGSGSDRPTVEIRIVLQSGPAASVPWKLE
jgi:hypothetical protein